MALLLALGLVAGIVGLATYSPGDSRAQDPVKRYLEGKRLRLLASKPASRLSFTEAEDGLVLARRLGDDALAAKFEKMLTTRTTSQRKNPHGL